MAKIAGELTRVAQRHYCYCRTYALSSPLGPIQVRGSHNTTGRRVLTQIAPIRSDGPPNTRRDALHRTPHLPEGEIPEHVISAETRLLPRAGSVTEDFPKSTLILDGNTHFGITSD
ncbi:hypothetical protein J6590_059932 [Homalodisca vitripennis]|nr:hypothetical protein J6590_059932 [Homalodisca vitripennis]